MEDNLENKKSFKNRFIDFYNQNKLKLSIIILIILIILISLIFLKYNNEKKNMMTAEKYVQAGLLLAAKNEDNAKKLYEEIIVSENKFYSILALNTIIEKDLISSKKKILEYFDILENSISAKDNVDLIKLKKALYLIKTSDIQKGNEILKSLIDNNSTLNSIAEELIKK